MLVLSVVWKVLWLMKMKKLNSFLLITEKQQENKYVELDYYWHHWLYYNTLCELHFETTSSSLFNSCLSQTITNWFPKYTFILFIVVSLYNPTMLFSTSFWSFSQRIVWWITSKINSSILFHFINCVMIIDLCA